ncbi:YfhO family protein [Crocinitomix catalasitica]|uniref:YfhO family protein n=1 Tax=Crocinitomix catalasitica TaxID=184607 RepID=UPI0004858326|nr:YfhO family protein [Crocinitomix catalasitica]
MRIKETILQKENLWHLGAIVLFIVIAISYFSPALKGYDLKQGDVTNFIGMSREAVDYRENNNENILWTNAMFSGMPTTQISLHYENTWLTRGLTNLLRLGLPSPIFFLFVYFISFYILSLSLRIKPFIGIIGSIAFGFSSYFIVILEAGHNTKAAAIGLVPLMLAGFIMAYRNKNWLFGVACATIFMALELSVNHVQITYYSGFLLLFLGIVEFVKYYKNKKVFKFVKITVALLLGYGVALIANYGNIFGTAEYAKQTIRGGTELTINPDGSSNDNIKTGGLDRDYVTNWSYGIGETFTLMVPNFKGGQSVAIGGEEANKELLKETDSRFRNNVANSSQYWGEQPFTSGPVYVGIIIVLLALLAMVYVKDKYKWALLTATLLAITLSWGHNFVAALVLLPILLYMVNIFLNNKQRLIFNAINTAILLFIVTSGTAISETSLTDFFLNTIPGYDKLRAVTIILVVVEITLPILGIIFLQKLVDAKEEIKADMNKFYIVSGALVALLLVFYILPSSFNNFLSAKEIEQFASYEGTANAEAVSILTGDLENVRIGIFKADVGRSLGFLIVSVLLIFVYLKTSFSKYILSGALAVLIFADLVSIDKRFINNENLGKNGSDWVDRNAKMYPFNASEGENTILRNELQANPQIKTEIDAAISELNSELKTMDVNGNVKQAMRDYTTFRVLNRYTNFRVFEEGNPFNSSYTSYFFKSIGGYHGAKLSRYQDLIDFHISQNNPAVLNMLNMKYRLARQQDKNGNLVTQVTAINNEAMGNAWLTKNIQFVENADEEIQSLGSFVEYSIISKGGSGKIYVNGKVVTNQKIKGTEKIEIELAQNPGELIPVNNLPLRESANQPLALVSDSTGLNWLYDSAPDSLFNKIFSITGGDVGGWDPNSLTIVDERFKDQISSEAYSGNGSIEMTDYSPDNLTYKFSSKENQFVVFSEIFYEDGWKAFIDDKEVPVSRVNYILRGIEIPAGEHDIRFTFQLESFQIASTMSLIANIIMIILLGAGIYLFTKRNDDAVIETIDEQPAS